MAIRREEIVEFLGEDWMRTVELMHGSLRSDISLLQRVNADILAHSGKMLRPMVSLLFAGVCGQINEDAHCFAAASELLHNATLLHDDVADESDTRRGNPTLRSSLGPSAAVLVGDFWLSRAVDLLIDTEHRDQVVTLFSKTLTDLAEGEMLQLQMALGSSTHEPEYYKIIYCKTASLFVSACESGAIAAGASESMREAARAYATALGTAFQIKDDILDYTGDGSLGKPVGIDLKEQKITLPLLCAMAGSPEEGRIRSMVKDIDSHPEYCEQIQKFVIDRGGVELASRVLEDYVAKALDALKLFPQSRYREMLEGIALYNSIRTN